MPSTDDFSRVISSSSYVMDGCLFQPRPTDSPHLLGFVHNQHAPYALFLIAGLTEGLMSLTWTRLLADRLKILNIALVQVNLKSSFNGFGFSSLETDAKELSEIIRFARSRWGYRKCFLLGHSTGAQICNSYMQRFRDGTINAVIFHSGISDREAMLTQKDLNASEMHEEAKKFLREKQPDRPISKMLFNSPISAYRFDSMYKRMGDDDMFSTDLTDEELSRIFHALTCPVLMIYGDDDEYVPDKRLLAQFSTRLRLVLEKLGSKKVECEYMPGDHSFTDESMYAPMLEVVARFLQHIL